MICLNVNIPFTSYFFFQSGSAYNRSLIYLVMLLHAHYLCLIDAVEEICIREYKQQQNQHPKASWHVVMQSGTTRLQP